MVENLVQYGFSAGVLSPALYHRSDLKKYPLGLAEGRNFIIDYLGGAITRPGTEFIDYLDDGGEPGRLVPFQFNLAIGNTYIIVFSKNKIRFIQDGAYILEASKAITTSGVTFTSASHGYSVGDWLRSGSFTLVVSAVTTNTFTCNTVSGVSFDPTGRGLTTVARIYTIASPYSTADLRSLRFDQDRDVIYINSPSYAERKLTRLGATNWTLALTAFSGFSSGPASVTLTPSASASAGIAYAVTAVDVNGREAPIKASALVLTETSVNFSATSGSLRVTWPIVAGAAFYRVYRGLIHVTGANVDFGPSLGLLGETRSTSFTDNNYIPDFTKSPLERQNPFADGAVEYIEVTAGGSGYSKNTATVSVSGGGGSGFEGKPIVDSSGFIIGVLILNPGSGYSSPTVSFTGGSGATATATLSGSSGNNPSSSTSVQQRRVRVGTNNNPLGVWGSRVGQPDVYDTSGNSLASDPFSLTLDAETSTPINHVQKAQDGFFLFCDSGVWQVRGVDDALVTASTAKAIIQTEEGCGTLAPLKIDREYVYLHINRRSVHSLRPSNLPTYFTLVDSSIFSSHYFPEGNEIVSWAWAKSPYKLIWAVRRDGTLLSHTFVPEQEVMAWSDHTIDGFFEDVCVVKENYTDRPYFIVRRGNQRLIVRMAYGEEPTIDETWSVDFGLATPKVYPAADLTVPGTDGILTVTASASVFTSGDVGKVLRVGGGKAVVTAFISGTQLTVQFLRPAAEPIPDLTSSRVYPSGLWTLMANFTTISGLDHLEGTEVEILADGRELSPVTVTGGSITLSQPASYVIAGVGFSGRLKTLPAALEGAVIGNMQKAPKALAIRLYRSRGLLFGDAEGDALYPLAQDYDQLMTGIYEISIRAVQDLDGSIVVEKRGPLAAHLLGYICEMEM